MRDQTHRVLKNDRKPNNLLLKCPSLFQPHFGGDREILTPSPQPPRPVYKSPIQYGSPFYDSEPSRNLEKTELNEGLKLGDLLVEKGSHLKDGATQPVSEIKEVATDIHSAQLIGVKENDDKAEMPIHLRQLTDGKSKLDEQYTKEKAPKGRRGSQDSSYSSSSSRSSRSSRGSVASVIKKHSKNDGQRGTGKSSDGQVERRDRRTHAKTQKNAATRKRPHHTDSSKLGETESHESKNVISLHEHEQPLMNIKEAAKPPVSQSTRVPRSAGTPTVTSTNSIPAVGPHVQSMSPQDVVGSIANAIKGDPNELQWLMGASASAKSRANEKAFKGNPTIPTATEPSVENQDKAGAIQSQGAEKSPQPGNRLGENCLVFNAQPTGSSSPQAPHSPEKIQVSSRSLPAVIDPSASSAQPYTPATASSHSSECNVFFQESPKKFSLEERELEQQESTLPSTRAPPPFTRVHLIPEFGETYTVRKARKVMYPQPSTVDPLKRRTSEIEDRLDKSLSPDKASEASQSSSARDPPREKMASSSRVDLAPPSFSRPLKQRLQLDSFDSAIGNMSSRTVDDTISRSGSYISDTAKSEPCRDSMSTFISAGEPSEAGTEPENQDETPRDRVPETYFNGPRPGEHTHPTLITSGAVPVHIPASVHFVPHGPSMRGLPSGFGHTMTMPLGTMGMVPTMYPLNALPQTVGPPLGFTVPAMPQSITGWGPGVASVGTSLNQFPGYRLIPGVQTHSQPSVHTVSATSGSIPSTLTSGFAQIPMQLQAAPRTGAYGGLPQDRTDPVLGQGVLLPPTPVIVPGEVKFPSFCCVGVTTQTVLPLHNSSSRWMQCRVEVVACTINGGQVSILVICEVIPQMQLDNKQKHKENVHVVGMNSSTAGHWVARQVLCPSPQPNPQVKSHLFNHLFNPQL